MQYSNSILFGLAVSPLVGAHMFLASPPALKSIPNKNTVSPDYSLTSPLKGDGSDYPCKGYHKLLGTPEGASVASWAAGSTQKFTLQGGASHNGGSCQVSLSFDGGKSFKVIKSFVGDCPASNGGDLPFTVPAHIPSNSTALFAWTWFNREGNREMYMDCAVVSITGGSGGNLDDLPEVFKANIGNGCSTADNADVVFPNPGSDVVNVSQKTAPPAGKCQQATPGGSQLSTNASSSIASSNVSSTAAPLQNSTTLASTPIGTGAATKGALGVASTKLSTRQWKNMTKSSSASRLVSTFVLTQTITTTQTASPSASWLRNRTMVGTATKPVKSSVHTGSVSLSASNLTSMKLSTSTLVVVPLKQSGSPQSTKVVTLSTPSEISQNSKVVTLTTPSVTPSSTKVVTLTTPSGTPDVIKPITPSAVTQSPKVVTLTTPSGIPDVIKPITPSALKESSSRLPATLITSTSFDPYPRPHKSQTPKPSTPETSAAPTKASSSSYNPYPYPKHHSRRRRQYTA